MRILLSAKKQRILITQAKEKTSTTWAELARKLGVKEATLRN